MEKEFNGFTVHFKNRRRTPLGVISENNKCQALSKHFPSKLSEYLIHIEDRKFYHHAGFDMKGIARACKRNLLHGKIIEGGSTITQQLARNILEDNSRTVKRKIKELVKAIEIEKEYSKKEILDLYFNNVYFGKNIRGVRAAGLHYFGKDVKELTQAECLYLLTILRGPNFYLGNPDQKLKRFLFLNKTLYSKGLLSPNLYQKNLRSSLNFEQNFLEILPHSVVPFISQGVSRKNCKIFTSLDEKLQKQVEDFRLDSKYPVSIIALKGKKVVAFSSSYGPDYPFNSRANVGSTLKPFLYCFLRNSGIPRERIFDAVKNNLDWEVREYRKSKSYLTLEEALLLSNNNAFINACTEIGLEKSIGELAGILKKDPSSMTKSLILGAANPGVTLFELATVYSDFFDSQNMDPIKKECLAVLNTIAVDKLGHTFQNAFLKTGTTNGNKERYAIIGNSKMTFAVLRNENPLDDPSKEGGFIKQLSKAMRFIFLSKKNYKWT